MGRDARVTDAREYRFFAGWRSDPFFFDTQGAGAAADQASRYARHDRIAIGVQKMPPIRERCVGVAQAVVAGEVCGGLRRRTPFEVGRGAA
jgi:hypothetical protein